MKKYLVDKIIWKYCPPSHPRVSPTKDLTLQSHAIPQLRSIAVFSNGRLPSNTVPDGLENTNIARNTKTLHRPQWLRIKHVSPLRTTHSRRALITIVCRGSN